jgi:hypothetical protein
LAPRLKSGTPLILVKLPKRLDKENRSYLPRRPHRSIKLDAVKAGDRRRYDGRFFCEDCSHYSLSQNSCTLGYRPQHTRAEQEKLYEITGKLAFCRALEIE